jgi:cytochrome c oxidase assembly protein subunit 11
MARVHTRTGVKLALISAGMFAFAWALVPFYDLLCQWAGVGGKTGGAYVYDPATVQPDTSRTVKINFITNTNAGMPWKFWAEESAVRVHPGELREVKFMVRNPTGRTIVGQAVPSVVPFNAAEHFHKTECFCFQRQVLKPGEQMEMPMRFVVGTQLPKNVQSISLAYDFFDVTELAAKDPNNKPVSPEDYQPTSQSGPG